MIFDISYLIFRKFTMKISIISASHRINSQSKKISVFLQNNLSKIVNLNNKILFKLIRKKIINNISSTLMLVGKKE